LLLLLFSSLLRLRLARSHRLRLLCWRGSEPGGLRCWCASSHYNCRSSSFCKECYNELKLVSELLRTLRPRGEAVWWGPTRHCMRYPICHCLQVTTCHFLGFPGSLPASQPASKPTSQPVSNPASQPANHPSGPPSSTPTIKAARQPVSYPRSQPVSKPSKKPAIQSVRSIQPAMQSANSTSIPLTSEPSPIHPAWQPSSRPISQPAVYSQPASQLDRRTP
jgi:hypothetical protein